MIQRQGIRKPEVGKVSDEDGLIIGDKDEVLHDYLVSPCSVWL